MNQAVAREPGAPAVKPFLAQRVLGLCILFAGLAGCLDRGGDETTYRTCTQDYLNSIDEDAPIPPLTIYLGDLCFRPDRFTMEAGQTVHFVVDTYDRGTMLPEPHALAVLPVGAPYEERINLPRSVPGKEYYEHFPLAEVHVTFAQAGEYYLWNYYHGYAGAADPPQLPSRRPEPRDELRNGMAMRQFTVRQAGPLQIVGLDANATDDDSQASPLNETVILRNQGSSAANLGGVTLKNESGVRYTFPEDFRLGRGAGVQVHTGEGVDDRDDLYMGRLSEVWDDESDTAFLYDGDRLVDAYWYAPPSESHVTIDS